MVDISNFSIYQKRIMKIKLYLWYILSVLCEKCQFSLELFLTLVIFYFKQGLLNKQGGYIYLYSWNERYFWGASKIHKRSGTSKFKRIYDFFCIRKIYWCLSRNRQWWIYWGTDRIILFYSKKWNKKILFQSL